MKLLYDFLPIVLFFITYKFYGIYVATAVTIVAMILQTGLFWLQHRRFEKMHLVSLALLIVLGGMTLILHDNRFIMWKPTLVNGLFAIAFLLSPLFGGKTLIERMLGHQISLPKAIWYRLNLAWIVFFLVSGLLNIYVAYSFSEATWVNFKLFGMLGLTIVFMILQGIYIARHAAETGSN